MKKRINSNCEIEMTGLNFEKFLNYSIQNNIKISDVKNVVNNKVRLRIDENNLNGLLDGEAVKNVTIVKRFGIKKIFQFIKKRLGLVIGCVISIVLFAIFNNFIFNINILGLTNIPEEKIIKTLEDVGVKRFNPSKFDNDDIENYLKTQIPEISLISVKKIGTSVVINIKEKLEDSTQLKSDIVAQYNMLITGVEVNSGTPNIKVGDIVKKGDVLVYAYMEDGSGELINCEPIANIKSEVWFTEQIIFINQELIKQRTGNKEVETNFFMGKNKITNNKVNCSFTDFECEVKEYNISTNLLPIRVKKVIYYELESIEITRNFEEEKDGLIANCYETAYRKVPKEFAILKEDVVISQTDNGYIISVYLKSNYSIRRNNED